MQKKIFQKIFAYYLKKSSICGEMFQDHKLNEEAVFVIKVGRYDLDWGKKIILRKRNFLRI